MENCLDLKIQRIFKEEVSCYRLTNADLLNSYYIVSSPDTTRLMHYPEIVGFDNYLCMLKATTRMIRYFDEEGLLNKPNILSILRGALNYPLEEACYRNDIRVSDISFLSSERVFNGNNLIGLEVKYEKLATIDDSTLLIGDIIASGDTFRESLKHVIACYRKNNQSLRNVIIFTIGGTKGIEMLEELTKEIREYWPAFEGFSLVYFEGIFSCYEPGEKTVTGLNRALVDFYWRNGIIAPEFRKATLSKLVPILEKCIIYDGGARRYEIREHIKEVSEFWEGLSDIDIDKNELLEEKLGHSLDIGYDDYVVDTHYSLLEKDELAYLYNQEKEYIKNFQNIDLRQLAKDRLKQFQDNLKDF